MVNEIKNLIKQAVSAEIDIEVSASDKPEFGHYSTNAAFKFTPTSKASSGLAGKSPFEIAKELALKLGNPSTSSGSIFAKIEAVQPGFINFWLKPEIFQGELKKILKEKKNFGNLNPKPSTLNPKKINLEFVSANPTGPLTMANGRGGFYGDVLANVLEKTGHKVTREYYVNDAGNQVRLLGESILAELGKAEPAENHYKGGYIKDLAKSFLPTGDVPKGQKSKVSAQGRSASGGKSQNAEQVGKMATKILLKEIKTSLKKAGIKHDKWFSENANLRKKGELKKVLEFLKKKGVAEEKDGATWFIPSGVEGLGDLPAEALAKEGGVLVKSDGNPTYFLADLAYHYDKLIKRKFDLAIDIWGADHHGYAQRMKKGVEALGLNPERLKILITQLVRLVSGGKEVRMSKRKGEFITMDNLLEEVGTDASRFFFLMHSLDTHMDFDLDLAKEKSNKNPVFYAQYALVRCGNILRKSKVEKSLPAGRQGKSKVDLALLNSDSEIRLMLELIKFPDLIAQTSEDYQVHRLTKYAGDVAGALHNFYEHERVVGVEKNLEQSRLALVSATKIVLENLFDILGISKPKKM